MRIDLNASVTWESVQGTAIAFFKWWAAELLALVPETLRGRISSLFRRYTLTIDGDVWQLSRGSESDVEIHLDTAASDGELRDLIARIEPKALRERVEVEISTSEILVRRVRLPAAARARLRSAVKLQLERLTPFRVDDVAFDCQPLSQADNGELEVEVAVVPIQSLRVLQQRLEKIGLHVRCFAVSDSDIRFAPFGLHWTREEKLQLGLGAAALVTAFAAFLLAPVLRDAELQALDEDIAQLRAPAHQASMIRDRWVRLREPLAAISKDLSQPSDLDVVKALTNALPNDVRLSLLTIDDATVHVEGIAPSAKHVADLLELAHTFSSVRLREHLRTPAGERFSIFLSLSEPGVPGT